MMKSNLRFLLMVSTAGLVLISLLGCAGPSPTAERTKQPESGETNTATPSPSAAPSDTPVPTRAELQATKPPPARTLLPAPIPTLEPGPVTGEVPPDLLDAILADAEARTGLTREELTVIRAESVTWRDGSLGCPQPGMEYTQALVPGYWVVLEAGGRQMSYHASDRDSFFLCESPLPVQKPLPGGEDK